MIKNHFHFTLKAIFILKTIKFLSWLFANVGKRRNKKAKVNFKIYDVIISKKIIAIQILPNISRSKNNQTIRFGQLIEYNMRKIYFEELYTKCGAGTSSRPSSYLCINSLKIHIVCTLLYVQVNDNQNILNIRWWVLVFISFKAFLKKTRGPEIVSCLIFWIIFQEKYFY